jgi:phosphoribosylformylglycinamidine cyclo-ligase
MPLQALTYSASGVSVARGDRFVDAIAPLARRTRIPGVLESIGGFAALARLPRGLREPLLVLSTDGVGTKVLLARELGRLGTVGIDLVAMSVNDILTTGARPLWFLDYYATGRLVVAEGREIVRGVAAGCRRAGCALVGGETAEMPQVYRRGDFDLAGFCVGVVDRSRWIDGRKVSSGDAIIGLPSSGVHSNGYSLVRAILRRRGLSLRARPRRLGGTTLGEALLRPTRIYVREVLGLLSRFRVHAMAHITGGGLPGNVPRSFPRGLSAVIRTGAWQRPELFRFLQEEGDVPETEMARTFNLGIGFVLVVDRRDARAVLGRLPGSRSIGEVVSKRGASGVELAD